MPIRDGRYLSQGGAMSGNEPASSVLEGLPVSAWHWRLVVVVGLGSFFDLYEVFLGGVLAPVLATEFKLGTIGKAMVIAAGFGGMFVGANVLSIVADRLPPPPGAVPSLSFF